MAATPDSASNARERETSGRKLLVGLVLTAIGMLWLQDSLHQWMSARSLAIWGATAEFRQGNVQELWFSDASSDFGDAELPQLNRLRHLQSLDLSRTQVTDSGLEQLQQFSGLRRLTLRESQISEQREEELRRTLPGLTIRKVWLPEEEGSSPEHSH